MNRTIQESLRFSFGMRSKQELVSARSTPKFPSIDIKKDHKKIADRSPSPRSYTQEAHLHQERNNNYRDIGGGQVELMRLKNNKKRGRVRQQFNSNATLETNSIQNQDNKSIKSTPIPQERLMSKRQSKSQRNKLQIKINSMRSLTNIFDVHNRAFMAKRISQRGQKLRIVGSRGRVLTKQRQTISHSEEIPQVRSHGKPERKQTKKIVNNFFDQEHESPYLQFRQTKRSTKSGEKPRFSLFDKEKIKNYKNALQKTKPTLRLGVRQLNNQKIETIAQIYSQQQITF